VLTIVRRNQGRFAVLGELLQLLVESLAELVHQSSASGNDNRAVESLPEINVTFLDAVGDHLVHSRVLESNQIGFKQDLGRLRFLNSELDDIAIGQSVIGLTCLFLLEGVIIVVLLRIQRFHVAVLFLDLAHNLELCRRVERVASSSEQRH